MADVFNSPWCSISLESLTQVLRLSFLFLEWLMADNESAICLGNAALAAEYVLAAPLCNSGAREMIKAAAGEMRGVLIKLCGGGGC